MTKSYTIQEFSEYVSGLKFDDIKDLLVFVKAYYTEMIDSAQSEEELFKNNLTKYSVVMSHFGHVFLDIVEENIKE